MIAGLFALLSLSTELWRLESVGVKSDFTHWKLGVATGTTATMLLVTTLSIGPMRVLRRAKPNPVHIAWRRTTGIWTAIVAWIHVAFGITIHSPGWRLYTHFLTYRAYPDRLLLALSFGYWVGMLAALTLLVLALTSNTRSMRWLGATQWKRVQRSTYLVFSLVVTHVVLLQYQEKRDLRHVAMTFTLLGVAVVVQALARGKMKRIMSQA